MAKKPKFPLEMRNGVGVRSMEELREHFSLAKALEYFENGKLVTWLRAHYADDIAGDVEALDQNEQELAKKLCEIFDVPYDENTEEELKKAEEKAKRLERLKEFTDDEQLFDKVDHVAFEQNELHDLLAEEAETIYLCGDRFSIPLSKSGVSYIGINNPTVVIDSKVAVDWNDKKISIEGVTFDEKYQKIVDEHSQEFVDGEDEESRKLELLKERLQSKYKNDIHEESKKLELLKKHGIEEWQIDSVAFNQKELNEILRRHESIIYLYGGQFSIPLDQEHMNRVWGSVDFKGINNPTVVIKSSLDEFLENKNVSFEGIKFVNDNFRKANLVKEALRYHYKKDELSIHEVFNSTAINQGDLDRLLRNGVNPIYLTGNEFFCISVDKENMKYIGINPAGENDPNVIIDAKGYVYLRGIGIELEDVNINNMDMEEYDADLEEIEYLAFLEAYEERYPEGSSVEETDINKAFTDYKNFMIKYQKTHPKDNFTLEEGYRMFFDDASSIASPNNNIVAGLEAAIETLKFGVVASKKR